MSDCPLAHSSPPDPYERHVLSTDKKAMRNVREALRFRSVPLLEFREVVHAAAFYHDLGKLDPINQAALRGINQPLKSDHIDAGIAALYKLTNGQESPAMWLIRGHHAPGFPRRLKHFNTPTDRRLRGRRNDCTSTLSEHQEQIERTNSFLDQMLETHNKCVPAINHIPTGKLSGLDQRIALSCLVDADHEDTAFATTGEEAHISVLPRWEERLESLVNYVNSLGESANNADADRNHERKVFFQNCLNSPIDAPMVSCEAPVGIGKTTSIMAYLLKQAIQNAPQLRRIIIVAPYTNILTQTAKVLRKAVLLKGENPDHVILEHHHRADFSDSKDRDIAVLWKAPIVLTTSVSFFETLSACAPGPLRKLHQVPGSAIFLDESHAALPVNLWKQYWNWMQGLTNVWGCKIVFASGSLIKFWENEEIVQKECALPELLTEEQRPRLHFAEGSRVQFWQLMDGKAIGVEELTEAVRNSPGQRLVILNTVQSAAIVAKCMRKRGMDVLHLSTALTPRDRSRILETVKERLKDPKDTDWTLVATSCVEAGVDISFTTAFRERFSITSILQIAGRVNRHGDLTASGGSIIYDFALKSCLNYRITNHPGCRNSAEILHRFFRKDKLNTLNSTELATTALTEEVRIVSSDESKTLVECESEEDYPETAREGRVITADTRFVVIDRELIRKIKEREKVNFKEILEGSVQIWATKINRIGILEQIHGRKEIYAWPENLVYDSSFLGYMEGLLGYSDFLKSDTWII